MPKLNAAKAANASFKPSYIPIAVFVGGTSGVGEAMVKALSSHTNGRVHLVIVGRNRDAAVKTFSSLPRPTGDDGQPVLRDFVYCDAYLMKNIKATCQDLSEKLPKINFLVLSAGYFRPTGRVETEEGLDQMLVMRYYNRFKYTKELLPLLQKAKALGEQAGMMSILGAGAVNITSIDTDDLDMKKKYGTLKAASKSIGYNDIMVEVSQLPNLLLSTSNPHSRNSLKSTQRSRSRTFILAPSTPQAFQRSSPGGQCTFSRLSSTSSFTCLEFLRRKLQSTCCSRSSMARRDGTDGTTAGMTLGTRTMPFPLLARRPYGSIHGG